VAGSCLGKLEWGELCEQFGEFSRSNTGGCVPACDVGSASAGKRQNKTAQKSAWGEKANRAADKLHQQGPHDAQQPSIWFRPWRISPSPPFPREPVPLDAILAAWGRPYERDACVLQHPCQSLTHRLLIKTREVPITERPTDQPGGPALDTGMYEELNVFGSPTGVRAFVHFDHPLPTAPVGHGWALCEPWEVSTFIAAVL
jgi:hypothetical protein